jgi:hypothetical protein
MIKSMDQRQIEGIRDCTVAIDVQYMCTNVHAHSLCYIFCNLLDKSVDYGKNRFSGNFT